MPAQIFGLDIGSTSLKLVKLAKVEKKIRLEAVGSCSTPSRGITSELPADREALATAIKSLVGEAKLSTKAVNVALPESQIYTQVREMVPLSDNELAAAIPWEAEQFIPLPVSEVSLDFQVLERPASNVPNAKMSVLLIAAPKVLVNKYLEILEMAGLEVAGLETEMTALCRAINFSSATTPSLPTLLIHLGALSTDITVLRNGVVSFTRSISTGGKALARAVASRLGFEERVAEEYKMAYGLREEGIEGKILEAIEPIFNVVASEIKRAMAFYGERHPESPLKLAILTGGTAKLPGILLYLAQSLGLEIQLGDPWQKIEKEKKFLPQLEEDGAIFTTAVGLALKGLV